MKEEIERPTTHSWLKPDQELLTCRLVENHADIDAPCFLLPPDAQESLAKYLQHSAETGQKRRVSLSEFYSTLDNARQEVDSGERFAVLNLGDSLVNRLKVSELKRGICMIARGLGKLLVQDANGAVQISVYDRDPTNSIEKGARYHQTHQGGSIHTDNVNQPNHWEYLVLGCVASGASGGESIIVQGLNLHRVLKHRFPETLRVLRGEFLWESRGFDEGTYRAPIITYNESGDPLYRYLRPYLEAAHLKAGKPLTPEQTAALDTLDTLLHSPTLQRRFTLQPGMVLITNDSQILHGRTAFVDHPGAVVATDENRGMKFNRTMERFWIKASGL